DPARHRRPIWHHPADRDRPRRVLLPGGGNDDPGRGPFAASGDAGAYAGRDRGICGRRFVQRGGLARARRIAAACEEHATKCHIRAFEARLREKHALLCIVLIPATRRMGLWPVKIASSLVAPAPSISSPSRRATGTGSSMWTARSPP